MSIKDNLIAIKNNIPEKVKLIVVSKNRNIEEIIEAYSAGQRLFGENRAQEITYKYPLLPKDIEWHFIGHLQSNKIKYISSFINTIQSVDSFKLLKLINTEAQKHNRIINCLLEFYIATEETKFGLTYEEAVNILTNPLFKELKNVKIKGIMGMASFSKDKDLIRNEFRKLRNYFYLLKKEYFNNDNEFCEISMGMSNDYKIAIEEGATIIRIGTAIFE
ncbi:MAG TPA: YggS family pyridoxal phosphate-dependent enzyme [Bacteroidales bacterium]|nr:YggS family pyridoxal phosphate-dependent enzyme [Bacteroidales bacterium]